MDTAIELEKYILAHIDEQDPVLQELERETFLHVLRPRMLSGHLQGTILTMFSLMLQPQRILEVGTYTGYSAICLAKGLADDGQLHTIELNDELESIAQKYFKKAGLSEKIIQHLGDAKTIIPQLQGPFDLIFLDGDKRDYIAYFDLVIDQIRPGGIILADNILWSGKVVEKLDEKDEQTKGILAFNQKIKDDPRVSQTIIPFRDGLMLIRKK
ncbi:O-methyltransferase [Sunxiuqinia elliptica]|uniref:Putative O-methyltransferase YrrM n=1 Tax=Sunxiuqinia elliptica TaxID=655355 RepID=A0A4R6HB89_9BACT|nr:O-methyltransferase [Sunxiuqinia elliptica]TDO05006.1 putative O-methyltransferase YrrM [Sunxiuqinia elliptica]TDO64554.1 putative O-methyltransferase YrrM [Sunxiuqinia elliptica]